MSDQSNPSDRRALLGSALQKLQEMQVRLDAAEGAQREPIAIVGMGCRFPGGADNPDRYWSLLREGVNAVREVPKDRWDMDTFYDPDPEAPGKSYTRFGGFLDQVDRFDPQFFGISPREALTLDPQQRLVLEVGWEALENAGLAANAKLRGSQTGVFVGIGSNDYAQLQMAGGIEGIDTYSGSGGGTCFAAGRFSYCLGLQGPSLSVDTACSSSLVAMHLACQSLRARECNMALAGGVNVIARPDTFVYLSKVKALAADGKCKAFDAAADGFVRGEGCGMIVLKRLSDALAEGDNVLAIIRGSAVNQDGASTGLTVPNGPAQQALISEALARSGVEAAEIDYVEAHGTGTALGDPIEMGALTGVFGSRRDSSHPLIIASVKTNLGHLEAAAGIAGVIKVILALKHGEIPAHLHYQNLNPAISFGTAPVVIPTTTRPWPAGERTRIAGVSAFGLSGTNAHVIIAEAPSTTAPVNPVDRPMHVLALSARSASALLELAGRHREYLKLHPELLPGDVCFMANAGRSHFTHRLAIVEPTTDRLLARLTAFDGMENASAMTGVVELSRRMKIAFLFTGQGAQYAGMGRKLYESQPIFRRTVDQVAELFRGELALPLLDVLFPTDENRHLIDETGYAQPALFALQCGLAELWRSWGVEPTTLAGHSIGEYAAAYVSKVLSLESAVKLVAARGRFMQMLPRGGAMTAVTGDLRAVLEAIDQAGAGRVSLAARNSPTSFVVSGPESDVESVAAKLTAGGFRAKRLTVSHAFHSQLMEPMLRAFEEVARTVEYAAPEIPWISTLTGEPVTRTVDARYWTRQIRESVRLTDAFATLRTRGIDLGVEIGPAPVLVGLARENGFDKPGWVGSLRKGRDEWKEILTALGLLYTQGAVVNWTGVDRDFARRPVALPSYPFQRERYWSSPQPAATIPRLPDARNQHPLLGREIRSPLLTDRVYETEIGADTHPFLGDHRVFDAIVFPAAAYLEMVLAVACKVFGNHPHVIEDMIMGEAMTLPEGGHRSVQVVLAPVIGSLAVFKVFSQDSSQSDTWTLHANGSLRPRTTTAPAFESSLSVEALRARCGQAVEIGAFYDRLSECGVEFGPSFRTMTELFSGLRESMARITTPVTLRDSAATYRIHPAVLDGGLQALGAALAAAGNGEEDVTFLPIGVERFVLHAEVPLAFWSHASVRAAADKAESLTADITLVDDRGRVLAEIAGLQVKRTSRQAMLRTRNDRARDWLYHVAWRPAPTVAPASGDKIPGRLLGAKGIAEKVEQEVPALREEYRIEDFQDLLPGLDALARAYLLLALQKLGWKFEPGDRVSLDSLASQLGVVTQHRALVGRILEILAAQGILERQPNQWVVRARLIAEDVQTLHRALVARFPGVQTEMNVIARCGQSLADALEGKADPLQLLFPEGSVAEAEKMYQDSPFAHLYNSVVGRAVVTALEHFPPAQKLRVLEIGGGTGGTTSAVLPLLSNRNIEYSFTDVSPMFLAKAREKFRTVSFVQYRTLDIERDPASQGFPSRGFDLVVAANVLHATSDLAQTMHHVQRLVAPGGLAILLEGTGAQDWVDLTFGLTPGWWKFADHEVRPHHALISARQWIELLDKSGFSNSASIPSDETTNGFRSRQAVIVAEVGVNETTADAWLIFDDRNGLGREVSDLLTGSGERTVLVTVGSQYLKTGNRVEIDPRQPEHYERLLAETGTRLRGIADLWALDTLVPSDRSPYDLEKAQTLGCESALYLVQAVARRSEGVTPKVFFVTRGVNAVAHSAVVSVLQSPLWGFCKVAALEHPEIGCVRIDLDPVATSGDAKKLFAEFQAGGSEDQIALRGGDRYVARLARGPGAIAVPHKSPLGPLVFHADASYLITGGLSGLGLLTARWMADRGTRHLVLMGRNEASASARNELTALEARGVSVRLVRGDVAKPEDVQRALSEAVPGEPPLRGVIHSAGVLDDGVLVQQTWPRFSTVMRPKVSGAWNLHVLTRDLPLDFFVVFSSAAALLGSSGQSNHAAANAFLDALVHYRLAQGRPGTSINWGAWSEVGAAARQHVGARVATRGMSTITPEDGLTALERLMQDGIAHAGVLPVDNWSRLLREYAAGSEPSFVSEIAQQSRASAPAEAAARESNLLANLQVVAPTERRRLVQTFIREQALKVLGLDPAQAVDVGQSLNELGLDSLMAVELRNRIGTGLKRTLPATVLFNYPSIDALTQYVCREVLALDETSQSDHPAGEIKSTKLDEFADDEVAMMLAAKLAGLAKNNDRADE